MDQLKNKGAWWASPSKRASSQGFAKGMRVPLPTSNVLMDAPSLGVPWPHPTVVKPIPRVELLVGAAEFLPMTLGQARPGQANVDLAVGLDSAQAGTPTTDGD